MEQQQQTPKTAYIDLRALNNAFVHNITSAATKITKLCICIPIDDNFIVRSSYVSKRTGKEVHTAIAAVKMWPVTDEDRAAAREKGIENPKDYNLRLDISDKAMKDLQQRDPDLAARLNFRLEGYNREIAKANLPYIGTAYDLRHRELPPEQVPTEEVSLQDENGDLPF
jgi:hypothetical protein